MLCPYMSNAQIVIKGGYSTQETRMAEAQCTKRKCPLYNAKGKPKCQGVGASQSMETRQARS